MPKKITNKDFISEASKIHDYKYDYSKAEYKNAKTKICIICPEHGEFWQTPDAHLRGQGCPMCSNNKKYTNEQFIKKINEMNGCKYDTSKVNYAGSHSNIVLICKKHGEFSSLATNILAGHGCPLCAIEKNAKAKKSSKHMFIENAIKIHGDKYDYSKVDYVDSKTKVCIICPIHGEFWQTPHNHLNCKQRCPKCSHQSYKNTTEEFIKKSREIHGDKYDYSKVEYINRLTPVCIICPKHGEFWQKPSDHLNGCGCYICKQSHLEHKTMKLLIKNNINYIYKCDKKYFSWLGKQHLDFYLPDYNVAIECQGIQHYKPIKYFGGINKFNKVKELDKAKKEKTEFNGIKLIYINYNFNESKIEKTIKPYIS